MDRGAIDHVLRELVSMAGPGEIRLEAGFDPFDPALAWLDPYDRRPISVDRALEIAGDVIRHRDRAARRSFAVGVTRWKRAAVTAFLDGPNGPPRFGLAPRAAAQAAAKAHGRVVVWASRDTRAAEREARAAGVAVGRLEDGFLRSVGLGAAFTPALSLVLDEGGVYYDPSSPSDLETLLREVDLPESLVARAARLRRRLVAEGHTKYNVGDAMGCVVPEGRFGVLAPGQVEDDASILRGAGAVRTNRDLLAAIRARRPDAFIVYKPHPDVVAGYRRGAVDDAELKRLADAVVVDGAIAELYPQCRAVETMTSLAGFEALLRGLEVTTHGQPFYAGWGLTEDLAPHPRRGRARSVDELVAAALILYPLYRDPVSGLPCGPETALDRIAEARARAAAPAGRLAARLRHAYALSRHRLLGPIGRLLK
jgi:capsular polysaccharide export protein